MSVRDKSAEWKEDIERPYQEIGLRIKEWRMTNKIKQEDLANSLGMKVLQIRLFETGKRAPTYEFFKSLREVYNVDLNHMITGE